VNKTLEDRLAQAVKHFWGVRSGQASRVGGGDRDGRAAVTGGKQLDGFLRLLKALLVENDIPSEWIKLDARLDLPGYYRPTKRWDLLVIDGERLLAVVELKSQVGPSFGNNFNNRVEEAVGSAQDLHTAYRERAFGAVPSPWLGYLMLLEDCPASRSVVRISQPFFSVFDEFNDTSYARRYELLGERLVLERLYTRSCLILSERSSGARGGYSEPNPALTFAGFIKSLIAHCRGGNP